MTCRNSTPTSELMFKGSSVYLLCYKPPINYTEYHCYRLNWHVLVLKMMLALVINLC